MKNIQDLICRFPLFLPIPLLLVTLIFAGCRKQSSFVHSVSYGIYYEECLHNCFSGYLVSHGKVYRDKAEKVSDHPAYNLVAENQSKFDIARELVDSIPLTQLMESGDRIGNPDGRDEGGIFLSIRNSKGTRTWRIDINESGLQPEIATYVRLIKSVHERLK